MLKAGDILYHGTSSEEDFDTPDGPAWFSSSRSVAEHFKGYHLGPRPRLLKFRVVAEPTLAEILDHSDFAYLAEEMGWGFEDYAEQTEDLVRLIEDRGLDGWIIPHNYPDGDDIMLLDPEQWVERV